MGNKDFIIQAFHYVNSKLAAAGACLLIIIVIIYTNSYSPRQLIELSAIIGMILYVYGIGYSILIDGVMRLLRSQSWFWSGFLHFLGGFLFFLIFSRNIMFITMFGAMGGAAATVFFLINRTLRSTGLRVFYIFCAPASLLSMYLYHQYFPAG